MAAIAVEGAKLDLGRVISATFGVLGRNFLTFLGLTALLVGLPTLVVSLGTMDLIADPSRINFGADTLGMIGFGGLLAIVTNAVLQGALVHGTVRDLNGRRASFGECLASGLRNFLPLILLSIVFGLAVGIGFVLFVVPGLMLWNAWLVAAPAKVAEGAGVLEALGRSAELTRGNRWRIFGLMLIFTGFVWIVQLLAAPIALAIPAGPQALVIGQLAASTVASIVTGLVAATGSSVIYTELRRLKEGVRPEALASLFD